MRIFTTFFLLAAVFMPTVSCTKTEKKHESNISTEQNEKPNKTIEGRLELGHRPGSLDSTAYYIKFSNKKYYFMDEIPNLDSYKNKDLVVEGEFAKKDFPGVFYMKESFLKGETVDEVQGIIYSDRKEYEENRTYYQIINPVIKIKEG